jgi:hypothetical protein
MSVGTSARTTQETALAPRSVRAFFLIVPSLPSFVLFAALISAGFFVTLRSIPYAHPSVRKGSRWRHRNRGCLRNGLSAAILRDRRSYWVCSICILRRFFYRRRRRDNQHTPKRRHHDKDDIDCHLTCPTVAPRSVVPLLIAGSTP